MSEPTAKPKPDDDDDDVNPYGVLQESEAEKKLSDKNKPRFGDLEDKFKRSFRGPAQGLLVIPVNLLIAAGSLTSIFGVLFIIVGVWPLIFTDAPPSDEEIIEAIAGSISSFPYIGIFGGFVMLLWGCLVCLGASKMQSLESYAWALAGAILGIPLLAGIFALIALRDPRVRAGFEEIEGGIEDNEEEVPAEDDEDEDDEEEEEEERPRPKSKGKR